jgi:hypothetical protein
MTLEKLDHAKQKGFELEYQKWEDSENIDDDSEKQHFITAKGLRRLDQDTKHKRKGGQCSGVPFKFSAWRRWWQAKF